MRGIVDGLVEMSGRATTADAVQWWSTAVCNLTNDSSDEADTARRWTMVATAEIRRALEEMRGVVNAQGERSAVRE